MPGKDCAKQEAKEENTNNSGDVLLGVKVMTLTLPLLMAYKQNMSLKADQQFWFIRYYYQNYCSSAKELFVSWEFYLSVQVILAFSHESIRSNDNVWSSQVEIYVTEELVSQH